MSLTDVIVADLDLFMAFYFVLLLILLFFLVSVVDFFRASLRWSFKVAVLLFIGLACLFVSLFSVAMWYILNDTSFVSHIYDGDLIEHLRRGL